MMNKALKLSIKKQVERLSKKYLCFKYLEDLVNDYLEKDDVEALDLLLALIEQEAKMLHKYSVN
jgi:hypothetical protein